MELIQGEDVGGYDGHHVSSLDAEWCDQGGYLEASMVGLWPRVGDVVIDDRRAITVDSGLVGLEVMNLPSLASTLPLFYFLFFILSLSVLFRIWLYPRRWGFLVKIAWSLTFEIRWWRLWNLHRNDLCSVHIPLSLSMHFLFYFLRCIKSCRDYWLLWVQIRSGGWDLRERHQREDIIEAGFSGCSTQKINWNFCLIICVQT